MILLILCSSLYGQQKIDSLEICLEHVSGREKIDIINELSCEYRNIDPKIGLKFSEEALQLSNEDNYKKGIATALQNKGVNLQYLSRLAQSLKVQEIALEMFRKLDDYKGIGESLINIGNIHHRQNDSEKALEFYLQARKLAEEYNDDLRLAKVYNSLGNIHLSTGNLSNANEFYFKSLTLYNKLKNQQGLTYPLTNMGVVFWNKGKIDSAMQYFKKAKDIDLKFGNKRGLAFNTAYIGILNMNLNKFDMARKWLNKAFAMYVELNDTTQLAYVTQNLGHVAFNNDEYKLAQTRYEQALAYVENLGNKQLLSYVYYNLSSIHSVQNNLEKAMEYRSKYAMLQDSVVNNQAVQKIAELETRFETEKKEQEIVDLKSEKELQEQLIAKQRQIKNILFIASLVILIIGLIIYYMYSLKNKANAELTEANNIIHRHREALEEVNREQKELLHELHELNATKDKFFSIIAHDLKSPLMVLLSGSRLLSRRIDNMEKIEITDIAFEMHANTEKLFELLDNLLQWARIQMGKVEIVQKSLNVNLLVWKWIELLKENATQKNIEIENSIDEKLQVLSDRNMIESIIHNLLANAIKFTNIHGKIEVFAIKQNDSIEIIIKDNGVGIPESVRSRLFGLEENISTDGTEGEKGTGLGLILCKEFVEKNEGEIWVKSKQGSGTEVHFTVPAAV